MKIEYWALENGEPTDLLDTITVASNGEASFATGKARRLWETWSDRAPDQAAEMLSNWSNGYVMTKRADDGK